MRIVTGDRLCHRRRMENRVVIGQYDTAIEAETLKSFLESEGIACRVENEFLGSILPYASQSLGGIKLTVAREDEAVAREALKGEGVQPPVVTELRRDAEPREENAAVSEVHRLMKRATYGGMLGAMLVPLIANIFSMILYRRAYRLDRGEFWRHRVLFFAGMTFNFVGVLFSVTAVYFWI